MCAHYQRGGGYDKNYKEGLRPEGLLPKVYACCFSPPRAKQQAVRTKFVRTYHLVALATRLPPGVFRPGCRCRRDCRRREYSSGRSRR